MGERVVGALDAEAIKAEIREFLAVNFHYDGEGFALGDDNSLFESGTVDQTGVLELVLFVEEAYGFDVTEAELVPENFDSVNGIAAYVEWRLRGAPAGS